MNGLSLFANIGIAETYLKDVGINIVVANELLENRVKFYKHLYPECKMIKGDITNESIQEEVLHSCANLKIDFIIATPPCQGMSIAGDMNPHDERNSLIKYAIDIVEKIRPKFIMFENVVQQLETPIEYRGREITIPNYIVERLGALYNIAPDMVTNAVYFGVPQLRKRAIILLTRKDLNFTWKLPDKKESPITLEEAFRDIPDLWPVIKEKEKRNFFPINSKEALSYHKWHRPTSHVWRNVECVLYTSTGNTAFDNNYYYPKKTSGEKIKGYNTTYHRMFWNKPAPTVTMYNGIIGSQNNVHPGRVWKEDSKGETMYTNPRVLTIYELMVVSSLPKDWDIPEWAPEGLIRHAIGEGIPPLMVKKIVENIPIKFREVVNG